MGCASCAAKVQKTLNSQEGVSSALVNFAAATATVAYNPLHTTPELLRASVQQAGYDLLIDTHKDLSDEAEQAHKAQYRKLKGRTMGAVALSLPLFIIGMVFMDIPYSHEIMWALSTPVVFWFGRGFFADAWKQLKHRSANMNTLVALSTGIAYVFSIFNMLYPQWWLARGIHPHVYFEASGVIIAFILLGRLLEERAKGNTSSALKKLMGLQPKMVTVVNRDGAHQEVPIFSLKPGDLLLVKPGEKIAVDGSITEGSSYVDERLLTGESIPVFKEKNAKVFAGTINQKGSFCFCAEKVGADTMLAQIIRMVQEAQGSRAPIQKLADRIAAIFVPLLIGIAVLSFMLWLLLDPTNGLTHGFLALVTVLIIACPCALGLATPTAIMVGVGKGAEMGILIKDAESLEVAKRVNVVLLDKTGTLTVGKPVVTATRWLHGDEGFKNIFYTLEKHSEHPFAQSVLDYFGNLDGCPLQTFESLTGKGVKGVVNGKTWFAGNERLMRENRITLELPLEKQATEWMKEAKTVIWFADDVHTLAVVAVADTLKPGSKEAVAALKKSGMEVYMLTGDNEATACEIAKSSGITQYRAGVLPHEKADFVKELQAKGNIVAMAGDGINDSAALAQADLSIAMGKGSDMAMDTAQMTIISSDLMHITKAIQLSKQTVATIKQNLFWAFIYNLIAIPIAAGILYPVNGFLLNPMIGGAAMALSSISVVTNSLRLKIK
ncbi:MAG: heavy metal translocating P-type ATPase [Bacteroidetes bacterium]|nr:heavy metal translocating P-type ATPase [Bacteroidota bacterium]